MVTVLTGDHLLHPFTNEGNGFMHPVMQLCLNPTQFRNHPLSYRFPPHDEGAVLPTLAAIMREAQEGEGVGFPFSTLLSILNGEPPELDQPCLFRMDFPARTSRAAPEILSRTAPHPFGIQNPPPDHRHIGRQ
jgi:hypothetical protein